MTSSTRRWNGPTGTTTDGCTASSATSHPPSSKPPTTLNQRHSNRSRHKYEVGNEPETVHSLLTSVVAQTSGATHGPISPSATPVLQICSRTVCTKCFRAVCQDRVEISQRAPT